MYLTTSINDQVYSIGQYFIQPWLFFKHLQVCLKGDKSACFKLCFNPTSFTLYSIFDFQEEFQRDAFEALQLQKDAKTQRITQQINMIEEELAGLTLVELQRKEERTDDEIVSMDYTLLRGIQ